METVTITVHDEQKPLQALPFGGAAPDGTQYGANTLYLTKSGKPWLPVMGEFHFSRCPQDEWRAELRKMQAGGVEVAATYVFWIHHEEKRGEWDFSGQRDLRRFLQLCRELNFPVFLRIGPWVHAEARNGGFPDWLQHDQTMHLRTNDPRYLQEVGRFYSKIGEQARGLLLKDGGPVIGVQIENEYGHCGGETGEAGMQHMRTLKEMALQAGLDVPYYTATGWGGANVVDGEMLPVQGGYADAPWEPTAQELPPSPNYLLTPSRNDALIGSDWEKAKETFTFDVENSPFLTAELGGGLQVTAKRRPLVSGTDTAALAVCKLASGANLLGYYMYHGGTNPRGKDTTLQESKATGSYTDVPVLSYDFQAPIGEYGELHASYRKLKTLHLFLREFGDLLAPAVCVFPANMVTDASDTDTLRCSLRHNRELGGGFLFVSNHQRLRRMQEHTAVFQIALNGETIRFPAMRFANHDFGIYPYHLPLGNTVLESCNAQLLCRLGEQYVFICREAPVFQFRGGSLPTLVLTPEQAENAWKFGEKLFLTPGALRREANTLRLTTERTEEVVELLPTHQAWTARFVEKQTSCEIEPASVGADCAIYRLAPHMIPDIHCPDGFLRLSFAGSRAELYNKDGQLAADWFATGKPWRVSLRRLGFPAELTLKIYRETEPVYYELPQDSEPRLRRADVIPVYSTLLPADWVGGGL
ncbi:MULTISPECIES: beta-galactosidase [Caproicibacterium]|uniref:Beta-galactosidase n=1 Tax=Caproicibacterium argilliputei TaxID=3030016 RepID=A0AA97D797_9FIRM|nr:beta-galactosidase [Caproicibacterium argilliputei]WOC31639.1 beta-galactosidase [Caproicibacterium argilliputei]